MLSRKIDLLLDDDEMTIIPDSGFHLLEKASGYKELTFQLQQNDPIKTFIQEKSLIRYSNRLYRIEEIHSNEYVAIIDRDDFKSCGSWTWTYESKMDTAVADLCSKAGWSASGYCQTTISITKDKCSALDIINDIASNYEIMFDFDNINKIFYYYSYDDIPDEGLFISNRINASKVEYDSDTDNFYNRVFARGKINDETNEYLTFSSINDGKDYVEDLSFYDKVIPYYIQDDRFEDAQSLLDYANETLKTGCKPLRSYSIDFIDLASLDAEEYEMYECGIMKKVQLLDHDRKIISTYVIIEYDQYPDNPMSNKIILSSSALTIESQITAVSKAVASSSDATHRVYLQAQNYIQYMMNVSGLNGYAIHTKNESYYMDNPDKTKAKDVLRINKSGVAGSTSGFDGPYNVSMLIDGSINADMIKTGTINVNSDLYVGNNIYLNYYDTEEVETSKNIYFDTAKKNYISRYTGSGGGPTFSIVTTGDFSIEGPYDSSLGYYGEVDIAAALTVRGSKNRLVTTKDYGERLLNAVESAEAMFQDYGSSKIGDDGTVEVEIEKIFAETITTDTYPYFIQLTKLGEGDLYVSLKSATSFTVKGTAGLSFDWQITAKQKGYEDIRLKEREEKKYV